MGCSAATVAICLASQLLKASKSGKYALLLSSENITHNQCVVSPPSPLLSPICLALMSVYPR